LEEYLQSLSEKEINNNSDFEITTSYKTILMLNILTISNCSLNISQGSGYVIMNHYEYFKAKGANIDIYGPESFQVLKKVSWGNAYRITLGMFILVLKTNIKKYDLIEFWGGESWFAVWYIRTFHSDKIIIHKSNGIEEHVLESFTNNPWEKPAQKKWYHLNMGRLYKYAEKKANLIVTVSTYDRDFAIAKNYRPASDILSIYPGMTDAFTGVPVSYDREKIIGFCGSWIERKGIHLIQKDIYEVLKKYPFVKVLFIGTGNKLDKEIVFPGIDEDRILIYPSVNDKKILTELYEKMEIAFMPSYHESFGLVLAEAMACGCAAVTSNTGFAVDLIHKEHAYIMTDVKDGALAEGVSWLLDNPQECIRIAKNGYTKVQSLKWELSLQTLESKYNHLLMHGNNKTI
jgi:glycosyltransferase involved in cell wall biosynthesis